MRTKQAFFFIFTVAFLYSAIAAAENQERKVSPFSAVTLRISGTVFLEQGDRQSVRVEANESTLEELVTEVKDRTLIIRLKSNNYLWSSFKTGDIKVFVTVPDIEALSISGSGNIESRDIKSRILDLTVSGSGDISIEKLVSERVKATVSGSGNVILDGGNTEEFNATISGSGKIKALEFEAANVNTAVSGSGNCAINVQDALKARVSGSGSISYKGNPQVDSSVSGSGRIKSL